MNKYKCIHPLSLAQLDFTGESLYADIIGYKYLMHSTLYCLSKILTLVTFSFEDGKNHWRTRLSCICGQSCSDQRCYITAPRASDCRGAGTLDFLRTKLELIPVCGLMYR